MKINQLFEQLLEQNHLQPEQVEQFISDCMQGKLSDVQIATFLALMRMKGETVDELTACALTMQRFAHNIALGEDLIDIVGTGGDGKNTFNISTISSFVVAGAGYKVAKHGNVSVSSRSGSADLLAKAGFHFDLSPKQLQTCIKQCNLVFLFAPHFHPAMKYARTARKELGFRTLFNLLGPLINPANVKRQVVGVASAQWLKPVAEILARLGSEHSFVIHSQDKLDEISICAPTHVVEYKDGLYNEWVIEPKDYGLHHPSLTPIIVNSPDESLMIGQQVLNGEQGAARDVVVLNSAAAIKCAAPSLSYGEAIEVAQKAIDSGEAKKRFQQLQLLTLSLSEGVKHD